MYIDNKGRRVLENEDIAEFLRKPLCLLVFGIIATIMAFNAGISYSRKHVEVHSITHHLAFIEIAGERNMYELDWTEPEPIVWQN